MITKLLFAFAKNQLCLYSEAKLFNLKPKRVKVENKRLLFVMTVVMTLLFSNQGFSQLSETFETGIPASWSLFGNGVGTSTWQQNPDGYLGSNAVSINPSADNIGDQNTAQYFLVTSQVLTPANGELHFFTKQGSDVDNGTEYQIRISTADQPDINGFNIVLQSYTESTLNTGSQTDYEEKIVEIPSSIPSGLEVYIAFVAVNTQNGVAPTGDEWFIDNVSLLEGCTEIVEDDFSINDITIDGATLNWSHPTATNFEIQVIPEGGTPANSGIPVSGSTYELTNLDADTPYDVYIKTMCDNTTESDFVGPFSFETLILGLSCESAITIPDISTTPYILQENLSSFSNSDLTYTTHGSNCLSPGITNNYLNGDKAFLTYTAQEDGLITISQTVATGSAAGENCFNTNTAILVYESCADVGVSCIAGTTTSSSNREVQIENLLVQAGQTYIIVVSSNLSSGAGICFNLEVDGSACMPPADITYSNLTEDSVNFSWDNIGGFASDWEYVVVPTDSGEPTVAGTLTATNTDVLVNTGLSPATTYDLYVRSICESTPGSWSNPLTFTTQCTPFDTPYDTDFTGSTNNNPEPCWTEIDVNEDGNSWDFIGGYATLRTNSNQNNNNDIYVSPQVNFTGSQKRVRYKHRSTNGISSYSVRLSTTGVGEDNFTTVLLPETQITNTGFEEIIVNIPESVTGLVNIAWVVEPNSFETATRIAIDDVFIEDKPACPNPLNPTVDNITTTTADLSWLQGDEETQWQVVIQDEGAGIPTDEGILVSENNPYTATNLMPANRYEYYVRAYCNDLEQSEWVGPIEFITDCATFETPFFESFNDEDPDTQKFCWSFIDANADTNTGEWMMTATHPSIQKGGGFFNPTTEFDDWLVSPAINVNGVKELRFKYRAQFSFFTGPPRFGVEVLISTTDTDPSSFSVISPLEIFTNSEYIEKSLYFEANSTVYIAFRVPPEFDVAGGASILNIDDVSITDAPDCPNPTDLVVDTTFMNGANLSWSTGFQETNWNVAVQPAGSGIPTGSGEAVTTTSFSATGLEPNTEYEFYVMADCTDSDSEWIGPVTFTTLCSAFTTPFTETFNTDSSSEECWRVVNDNDDIETWQLNSSVNPFEGDQTAAMFTGTNGNNEDWLISPTLTITNNQRLRYYYRVNDSFFTEDLEVLLSTNGIGLDQFTTVLYDSDDDPVTINNVEWKVKIINLPDGLVGDVNIAFHVPYFESTQSYRGQTLFIDNVIIEDTPDCPQPTNLTFNTITDTTVEVEWESNGSEPSWELSVQPFGTDAPVGETAPEYLYSASTNPFVIDNLTAASQYEIYVRAVCDDSSESEWEGPYEVITKCSFENLCQYTISLTSDSSISSEIQVIQNEQVVQALPFNGTDSEDFTLFLCSGVEFSLYFETLGTAPSQYENYQVEVLDDQGNNVFTSPIGLTPRTTIYTGVSTCGTITCPQPTDLSVSPTSILSWTAGDMETEWEVAIQPIENGTLPQEGTLVSTNSYTPVAEDFNNDTSATYEFFVRAVCGEEDESYWSGPFPFVRNDDISNAIELPVNSGEYCNVSGTEISFIGATQSNEAMSCDVENGGDVWFTFTAESPVHIIEVNGFTGSFYENSALPPYPYMVTTLYREEASSGNLVEVACNYENALVAMNSSELVVGETYKVRLTLEGAAANAYRFNVCIKTPLDLCEFDTVNGGFETPPIQQLSGVTTISVIQVIPGWRQNLDTTDAVFIWESLNAPGFEPYSGGQCVQLLSDQGTTIDPNDSNIKGLYRDFDSSETTLYDFSFAHLARFAGNTVQLFAGPPEGPFTMVNEHVGEELVWTLVTGSYEVPENQEVTRFIFRASDGDDIGNVLDEVSFIANNEIITQPYEVDCNNATGILEANGAGTWLSHEDNPGEVTFNNPTDNTTSVTDFIEPGSYTFIWKTRYCENSIELTYNGISAAPTVEETLVTYCLDDTAQPLLATTTPEYTLVWYSQETGGTGNTNAPIPETSSVGSTSYYVANADANGCEGPRTEIVVQVNDTVAPVLSFSYENTCSNSDTNTSPQLVSGFSNGGTFTSNTLTVDSVTGIIDITTATVGVHDITYMFSGDNTTCTLSGTNTVQIEILQGITPVTQFNYSEDFYCTDATNPQPELATDFTTGGTFSATGLIVNAVTGEVDLSSATAGTYDIVYTYTGDEATCTEDATTTTTITIVDAIMPVTEFSYENNEYCAGEENIAPIFTTGFTTGGSFTSNGLTVNTTTGVLDLSTAAAGTYDIIYTYVGDVSTCTQPGSFTTSIVVNESSASETNFSYDETYCSEIGTATPTLAEGFTSGGTFSSETLNVNAETGVVDLSVVIAGTYEIVYTYDGDDTTCTQSGMSTATLVVTQSIVPETMFSYQEDIYCSDSENTTPQLASGFTAGGIFTAESGLSINTTTGEINVADSSMGNYTITYEVAQDVSSCIQGSTSTFNITVLDSIQVEVTGACDNEEYILTASPTSNSFNANEATYTWVDANGNIVGNDTEFNVSTYAIQNPQITVPAEFTVTVTFGGCSTLAMFATATLSCTDVPRGISPDGNNKNDTFDLTGLNVVQLNIFNRYGREVFKYNGNYTNQWAGQSNNGDELPDGTYFYSIQKQDGQTLTGWVYINRAH